MPPATTPPSLLTLILMTVVGILSLNMMIPSLANMAADFDVTYAQASLSVSLFMVVTAVLQLVVGPISDLFGRRPVALASIAIFVLASVGCVMATSFATFMIFRVIQGVIAAAIVLPRTIVRDTSSPRDATAKLGTIGMAIALGPMLAPLAGGLLDEAYGWQASFHAFWIVGLALLVLCWVDVGETNKTLGTPILAHFRTYPLLFGDRAFWSYTLCLGFSVGTFFAFIAGAPIVGSQIFGLSPSMIGLTLGAPPVGFLIGSWLSTRLAPRIAPGRLLLAGRIVVIAGLAMALILWTLGVQSPWVLFGFMPAIGIGNGLTNPAANVGAMSVRSDLAGSASGVSGATTIGIGAAMTAIAGWTLTANADPLRLLLLVGITAVLSLLVAGPALRHARAGFADTT